MKQLKRMKKVIAVALALCMILGMMPAMRTTVSAADSSGTAAAATAAVTSTNEETAAPTAASANKETTAPTTAASSANEETTAPTTAASSANEETVAPTTAASSVNEEATVPTAASSANEETTVPTAASSANEETVAPTTASTEATTPVSGSDSSVNTLQTDAQPFASFAAVLSTPFNNEDVLTSSTTRTTPLDFNAETGWQTGCTQSGTTWTNTTEKWSYDTATKTLTLSGATIDCSAVTNCPFAIALPDGATISVEKGTTNTIKGGYGLVQDPDNSIAFPYQSSFTVYFGTFTYNSTSGLYSDSKYYSGNITGTGALDLSTAALNSDNTRPWSTLLNGDTITIGDKDSQAGPVLTGTSGDITSLFFAFNSCCDASTTIMNGGSINFHTGKAVITTTSSDHTTVSGTSYLNNCWTSGIYSLTMNGGTVTITGGSATASSDYKCWSDGIEYLGSLTGGTVTAAGADASSSYGVYTFGNTSSSTNHGFTGGTLYATGKTGAVEYVASFDKHLSSNWNVCTILVSENFAQPADAVSSTSYQKASGSYYCLYTDEACTAMAKTATFSYLPVAYLDLYYDDVTFADGSSEKELKANADGTVTLPEVPDWNDCSFAGWYCYNSDNVLTPWADAAETTKKLDASIYAVALWKNASGNLVTPFPLDFTGTDTNWKSLCTTPTGDSTLWVSNGFGWSYDTASNTLTLNNATIECSYYTSTYYAINLPNGASIKLADNSVNTVKSGSDASNKTAIAADSNVLRSIAIHCDYTRLSGNGELDLYSADLTSSDYSVTSMPVSGEILVGTYNEDADRNVTIDTSDHPALKAYAGNVSTSKSKAKSIGASDIFICDGTVLLQAGTAATSSTDTNSCAYSFGTQSAVSLGGALSMYGSAASCPSNSVSVGAVTMNLRGGSVTAVGGNATTSYGAEDLYCENAAGNRLSSFYNPLPYGSSFYAAGITSSVRSSYLVLTSLATMTGSTTYYKDPATANLAAAYQMTTYGTGYNFYTSSQTMDSTTKAKTVKLDFVPGVDFYNAHGTFPDDQSTEKEILSKDGIVTLPTAPVFSGYSFAGWHLWGTDPGEIWAGPDVKTMPVTENIDVASLWKNQYGKLVMTPGNGLDLNTYTETTEYPDYGISWYPNGTTVDGTTYTGKVLVLDNATILSDGKNGLVVPDGTTVILKGNSTISASDGDYSIGLKCYTEGDHSNGLTIAGDGSLNVTAGKASSMNSLGIYSDGSITVSNGTVTANGGEATDGNSAGISSGYGAVTINDGTVTATGGTSDASGSANGSAGISAGTDFTINNGTLTAAGGSVTGNASSLGIMTGLNENLAGKVTFNGGTSSAIGGTAAVAAASGLTVSSDLIIRTPAGATIDSNTGTFVTSNQDPVTAVTISPLVSASVTPVKATFDKYTDSIGVTFTLEQGDDTLVAITENGKTLMKGIAYTVTANTYTFTPGYLKQESVGTVTFTFVMSSGTKLPVTVTVSDSTPVVATGLTRDVNAVTLSSSDPTALKVSFLPANTTNQTLIWTSSNSSIATVDENGILTPIANGTVTITAKTTDSSNLKVTFTVTVNIPSAGTSSAAETATDAAGTTDETATDEAVTDTSANTGDQTPFAIYSIIAILSLLAAASLGFANRKREN